MSDAKPEPDAERGVDRADTLPASGEAVAGPGPTPRPTPGEAPTSGSDIELQQLRSKVHGRLFGTPIDSVTIGRYEVTDYIGSGGMGIVYAAHDPELDRRVAIKVLRSDSLGDKARARLRREAKALAKLSHANVVHVYEVGQDAERVFVAMEYVEGSTLTEWLGQETRTWTEVVDHFVAAGRGLSAAHDAGLVHRDFKPDNVLLDASGRPRVVDFGLAMSVEAAHVAAQVDATTPTGAPMGLTATGALMGTPAYMAPEQHLGGASDARTDIFAFCVALYEALFGQRPFRGDTYADLAKSVIAGDLRPPPPSRGRRVPKALRRAIERGLQRAPEDRPTTMSALLDAIESARDPSKTSTRAVAGLLVLLTAGAGAALFGAASDREATEAGVCDSATAKLEGIWDETTRGRVAEAFAATGQSFASDTYERVAADLDEWTAEWTSAWAGACGDALGKDAKVAERGMRQMRCLDVGLTELRQLSELFVEADADAVAQAVTATGRLSSPAQCQNPDSILAQGEGSEEAVDASRSLARAKALLAAGRRRHAMSLADQVVANAQRLELPGLEARAELVSVQAADGGTPLVDRIGRLHSVVALASEAGDEHTQAAAWIEMVRQASRGPDRSYLELAHSWADMAERILSRKDDPELSVELHLATARLYRESNDLVAARYNAERAASLLRTHGRERAHHGAFARAAAELGRLEAEAGRHEIAVKHLREAVESNATQLGRGHPDTVRTLLMLADVTEDDTEAAEAASEAYAVSLAGRRADEDNMVWANYAMQVLGRVEPKGCEDAADEDCDATDELRALLENQLEVAGVAEASEIQRIAAVSAEAITKMAHQHAGPHTPVFAIVDANAAPTVPPSPPGAPTPGAAPTPPLPPGASVVSIGVNPTGAVPAVPPTPSALFGDDSPLHLELGDGQVMVFLEVTDEDGPASATPPTPPARPRFPFDPTETIEWERHMKKRVAKAREMAKKGRARATKSVARARKVSKRAAAGAEAAIAAQREAEEIMSELGVTVNGDEVEIDFEKLGVPDPGAWTMEWDTEGKGTGKTKGKSKSKTKSKTESKTTKSSVKKIEPPAPVPPVPPPPPPG